MLTATGLSRSHGNRTLFKDVTIRLLPGHRTALVGGNGVGKTTLLEILVGIHPPDTGEVHASKDLRIGYLPQDLTERVEGSVIEATMAGATHINEVSGRLAELEDLLATTSGSEQAKAIEEYGEAQSRFEQLGGYALEAEAHRVLAGLGFTSEMTSRPVAEMSGGWRMRVALGRLLLSEPDILVLDEPTNHLDVDSVAWLEDHLSSWSGALLFVSHDRDFIDGVANRVVEIIGTKASEYLGGFAEFVVLREEELMRIEAIAAQQSRKIAHMEQFIERFRYKATKARQVQSRLKLVERLEKVEVPDRKQLQARFAFPEPRRSGRVVVEMIDVVAGYDDQVVLRDVNAVIERGRKIALVGPNGAGKTTLVRMLLGELPAIEGEVTIGNNVDVATFDQHQTEVLDLDKTVIDEFRSNVGDMLDRNVRTVLGSFGFSGDAADRRVVELSGGEQTRLALAMTMAKPVNLLVLDEPTNHLDLPSCDLLEDALRAYPGTVVLVTHDRHLIRGVADALLEVRGGTARWHEGVDEAVLAPGQTIITTPPGATKPNRAPNHASGQATKPAPGQAPGQKARKRTRGATAGAGGAQNSAERSDTAGSKKAAKRSEAETRNERHRATKESRKELARVERQWEAAENEVAEIQARMAEPSTYEDTDLVKDLTSRHDVAKNRAADLMTEWERLSARSQ